MQLIFLTRFHCYPRKEIFSVCISFLKISFKSKATFIKNSYSFRLELVPSFLPSVKNPTPFNSGCNVQHHQVCVSITKQFFAYHLSGVCLHVSSTSPCPSKFNTIVPVVKGTLTGRMFCRIVLFKVSNKKIKDAPHKNGTCSRFLAQLKLPLIARCTPKL